MRGGHISRLNVDLTDCPQENRGFKIIRLVEHSLVPLPTHENALFQRTSPFKPMKGRRTAGATERAFDSDSGALVQDVKWPRRTRKNRLASTHRNGPQSENTLQSRRSKVESLMPSETLRVRIGHLPTDTSVASAAGALLHRWNFVAVGSSFFLQKA
jgi:hypothetical protein